VNTLLNDGVQSYDGQHPSYDPETISHGSDFGRIET